MPSFSKPGFAMKLGIKATTYGTLSVEGKKVSSIIFKKPDKQIDIDLERIVLYWLDVAIFSLLVSRILNSRAPPRSHCHETAIGSSDGYCQAIGLGHSSFCLTEHTYYY